MSFAIDHLLSVVFRAKESRNGGLSVVPVSVKLQYRLSVVLNCRQPESSAHQKSVHLKTTDKILLYDETRDCCWRIKEQITRKRKRQLRFSLYLLERWNENAECW